MPLTMLSFGERHTIERVNGKCEARRFLESLGFVPGSIVTVATELNGNLIVNEKGSRTALSKFMASKIFVS